MRDTGFAKNTIRAAICRSPENPGGAFPYTKQKQPQFDARARAQRVAYAKHGPISKLVASGKWDQEKRTIAWGDHTPASKTGAVNRSHDPCWLNLEDKKKNGVPSAGSSKYSCKPQVYSSVIFLIWIMKRP